MTGTPATNANRQNPRLRRPILLWVSFTLLAGAFACARQPATAAIATPTVTTLSPVPATVEPVSPSETATSSPTTTATPEPTPAVLLAVGDAASCSTTGDDAVAALIESRPGTVAVIGDTVYDRGRPSEYAQCYDPVWGRFKDRTRPAVGNHEYLTASAGGYFDYFGAVAGDSGAGYYSYDLGAWHIVVINSMCWEAGGCGRNDPQAEWLKADLAAHPALCTLAYWHFPRFSSGHHGSMAEVDAYWDSLYEAGAEVVLTGHDHDYERFAPQDGDGRADPERGLREFVVGTGGFTHYSFPGSPLGTSEVRDSSSFGILVMTLFEDHYEWEFVPIPGDTFVDSGSGACHP